MRQLTSATTIIQVGSAPMAVMNIHTPDFATGKAAQAIEVNSDSVIFRVTEEFAKPDFSPVLDLKEKQTKAEVSPFFCHDMPMHPAMPDLLKSTT
jgi:hypothetical protein